jgi:hypothetical protein
MDSKFDLFGNRLEAKQKMSEQLNCIRGGLLSARTDLLTHLRRIESRYLSSGEEVILVSLDKAGQIKRLYRGEAFPPTS